jgi:hypothetical protein
MKKVVLFLTLLIFFSLSSFVSAMPFLYTTSTDDPVTSYMLILDGIDHPLLPYENSDGTVMGVIDLGSLNLSNGVHNGTIQAFNTLWGIKTDAVPFEFTKPASLTNPSIGLSSIDPRQ